ncbi:MAG: sugar phosphate isomerase/epimerase [Chloroflexi bacterium]|nr:sugar phosphate isomerase/epimerase [Chloroflexota bacterium]
MKISLSTTSLIPYPLATIFAVAKELGFQGLELGINGEVARGGISHIRDLCHQHQMPILSLHPPMRPLPNWRTQRKTYLQLVDWARELGVSVVTFHGPGRWSKRGDMPPEFLALLLECRARAQGQVTVSLENGTTPWSSWLDRPRNHGEAELIGLERLAQEHGFSLTLDTTHAAIQGGVMPVYKRLGRWIANVHLSDRLLHLPPLPLSILDTVLLQHQVPGTGSLPLAALIHGLGRSGYGGPLTLEVSNIALRGWNLGLVKKRLAQGVAFCREHTINFQMSASKGRAV